MAQDPAQLAVYIDAWLLEPAFAQRMAWRYNESLHTAVALESTTQRRFGLSPQQSRAVGWAPLEHVAQVIAQDRPFSEVVTAQTLPLHSDMAATFGWEMSGQEWDPQAPPDARPMAGILSSPTLWLVMDGDATNLNRARANAVARVFLCADFFDRDARFEFDLSPADLQLVESAAQTEPACQSCHAALDPLAAMFGGFSERSVPEPIQQAVVYSPFTDAWFRSWLTPAYYGQPLGDLQDLGERVAADPRFAQCAAERLASGLLGRPLTEQDPLADWSQTLRQDQLRVAGMARQVLLSPEYGSVAPRTLSTEQLHAVVLALGAQDPDLDQALSGLLWDPELRVMAGGSDDFAVLERNASPSLGHHLALAWAGRELAAVTSLVGPTDEGGVRSQLMSLHVQFLSRSVAGDSGEIDALYALFLAAGGFDAPERAWDAVTQALVRHPDFLVY